MPERQIHCEPSHDPAATSIMTTADKVKKMPDTRQPECSDFSNDEVKRDRYRMR